MTDKKTDALGNASIAKLLLTYSLPAIVATLINSLYNIVDRIFIGHGVGSIAISGLALTLPIAALQTACGMLIGAGAGARISIVLGQKDKNWAEKILANALILSIIVSGLFILGTMVYMDELLMLFGGSEQTIPYAKSYLQIVIPGSVFATLTFSFCNMIRASGYPTKSMMIIVVGAILNTVLDPIFIFGLGLGIKGGAIATVISMVVTAILALWHFIKDGKTINFHRRNFQLKTYIIRNILAIGISPFLINLTAAVVTAIISSSLMRYGGDLAIGAYGIINSFAVLIVMIIIGLCQGMQPIVGYNYGAGKRDRMREALVLGIKVASVVSVICFIIAEFFPKYVAIAFTNDKELTEMSVHALRVVLAASPFIGFQIVITNFFQSIGKVKLSILLSLSRQVLFLIPMLFILPPIFELSGVWLAMPVADSISVIFAAVVLYRNRHIFRTSMGTLEGLN